MCNILYNLNHEPLGIIYSMRELYNLLYKYNKTILYNMFYILKKNIFHKT